MARNNSSLIVPPAWTGTTVRAMVSGMSIRWLPSLPILDEPRMFECPDHFPGG
jgi:hypothetical protein